MIGIDMLCVVLGLAVGFGTGWICYRGRELSRRRFAEEEVRSLKSSQSALQIELARISERNRLLEENHQGLQNELTQERQFNISLHAELSRERTNRNHLEKRVDQQKGDLHGLQQHLTHDLKTLVEQVFQEKSQTFTEISQSNLHLLLEPISEKLQEFKQRLEEQHDRETHELIVLHNKLANLESGRRNTRNGINGAQQLADSVEVDAEEYAEYSPETAEAAEPTASSNGIHPSSRELPVECGGSHTFTPKQQVEIDNFFKRTVGKATRKKTDDQETDSEE